MYRVLHPEDSRVTVNDVNHVSIKNIITNGCYNDLGFVVKNRLMILAEAQSTWSVNIIPRCIMHLASTGIEARINVLEYRGSRDIVDQYIAFCKIADEQREKYSQQDSKAV